MNPEQMKATARCWLIGIWDEGNFALIDELASEEYIYEGVGHGAVKGQQFRDLVSGLRHAFPDLRNITEEQVAEGETVVTRGTTTGTQRGALGEIPPTGKAVAVPWVIITKFANGRVIRDWELYDAQGMMTQLAVIS